MQAFLRGWAIIASLVCASAHAQPACSTDQPEDPDYRQDSAADWPIEAGRLAATPRLASREGGSLTLSVDGGRTVSLSDCPYGDGGYRFLYERYDQSGAFHVVRQLARDDIFYRLVLMHGGAVVSLPGLPIWTSERTRFLSIGCSLEPARATLSIQAPGNDGLVTEAEFPLPCERESCSARFDHQSWIAVTCVPRDDTGKRGSEFVLIRDPAGRWNRFGR